MKRHIKRLSKQPLKNIVSMLIKEKDITSYQLLIVNKTRSCACKLKYLLLWLVNLEFFFFFTFRKEWVGRAMGNETFYWDGLFKNRSLTHVSFYRQLFNVDVTEAIVGSLSMQRF